MAVTINNENHKKGDKRDHKLSTENCYYIYVIKISYILC